MPFVEATLRESMRLDTLAPNGVPHLALNDTKVGGYDLPKVKYAHLSVFNKFLVICFHFLGWFCFDRAASCP